MKKITIILIAIIMCTHISAQESRIPSKGYALFSKDGSFQPYEFTRHSIGEHDILIRTLYCGICHSDIHQVHSDWKEETYPIVPGHEIVGEVVKVGGTLAVVGMPAAKETPNISVTALRGRYLTTSIIGGIKETQEVVDYSLVHDIYPEMVVIPADASAIDKAYQDVIDGKVKFRYVIDLRTIK